MNTMTRKPTDAAAVGAAVTAWMASEGDEADIALEAVLLANGVIDANEAVVDINYDDSRGMAPTLYIEMEQNSFSVTDAGLIIAGE